MPAPLRTTSLEAGLRRLRTHYVDLLWVHARDVFTPVGEIVRALDEQVHAGKVLYVAVSDTEHLAPRAGRVGCWAGDGSCSGFGTSVRWADGGPPTAQGPGPPSR